MSGVHRHERKRHGSGRRAHRATQNRRKKKLQYGDYNYTDVDDDENSMFFDKNTWAVNKKMLHGQNKIYGKSCNKNGDYYNSNGGGDEDDESE